MAETRPRQGARARLPPVASQPAGGALESKLEDDRGPPSVRRRLVSQREARRRDGHPPLQTRGLWRENYRSHRLRHRRASSLLPRLAARTESLGPILRRRCNLAAGPRKPPPPSARVASRAGAGLLQPVGGRICSGVRDPPSAALTPASPSPGCASAARTLPNPTAGDCVDGGRTSGLRSASSSASCSRAAASGGRAAPTSSAAPAAPSLRCLSSWRRARGPLAHEIQRDGLCQLLGSHLGRIWLSPDDCELAAPHLDADWFWETPDAIAPVTSSRAVPRLRHLPRHGAASAISRAARASASSSCNLTACASAAARSVCTRSTLPLCRLELLHAAQACLQCSHLLRLDREAPWRVPPRCRACETRLHAR